MKAQMKKIISEKVLELAIFVAEKSCGTASFAGVYQPKEPENLAERLAEMKKAKAKK